MFLYVYIALVALILLPVEWGPIARAIKAERIYPLLQLILFPILGTWVGLQIAAWNWASLATLSQMDPAWLRYPLFILVLLIMLCGIFVAAAMMRSKKRGVRWVAMALFFLDALLWGWLIYHHAEANAMMTPNFQG
jgi:hypothetical protein